MSEYIVDMSCSKYSSTAGSVSVSVSQVSEEIVRCKDCACLAENGSFYDCKHFGCHLFWNEGQEPDGFCSWGERRQS